MEVLVIFHDRSSGRLKLGVMSSQTVGQEQSEMMARLPLSAAVKVGTMDDGPDAPIEVAVGGAARFYLDNGPSYNVPRDGYWDIYTEQTGHQFCLGEVRRPRTWAELVHVVRGLWATIPERELQYHREQDAMDMEALRTYPSDSESNADFTEDEEMEAALEERRAFPRRNSDVSDDEV